MAEKGFELNTWDEKGQYVVAKGRKERQEEKKKRRTALTRRGLKQKTKQRGLKQKNKKVRR